MAMFVKFEQNDITYRYYSLKNFSFFFLKYLYHWSQKKLQISSFFWHGDENVVFMAALRWLYRTLWLNITSLYA